MNFFGQHEEGFETSLGARDFVVKRHKAEDCRGTYTCIKWTANNGLSDSAFHAERLENGARRIGGRCLEPQVVERAFRNAEKYAKLIGENSAMVTIFVHPGSGQVWWHVMGMHCSAMEVGEVLVTDARTMNGNREGTDPVVKGSQWIFDRVILEERKALHCPSVAEVVMVDSSKTALLEGLISNVFVVKRNGVVQTAVGNILYGWMRKNVVDVCRELGITVELCSPKLSDCIKGEWADFFLTSVAKPAVRVKRLVLDLDGERSIIPLPGHDTVDRIQFGLRQLTG